VENSEGAKMMDAPQQTTQEDRRQQARRLAADRFRREPDWVSFYRDVLGVDGIVDQIFPTVDQRNKFERTPEYAEIQQMVARLRERNRIQKDSDEPTRVITVRLPQSLHESLRHEAHNMKTSMNKLCISKLLQVIADDLVPSDFQRRETESPAKPRPEVPQFSQPQPTRPMVPTPTHTAPPQTINRPQPSQQPFGTQPTTPPSMPGGRPF